MKMAADSGYAYTMFQCGLYLQNGVGVDVNLNEALRYYKMADDNRWIFAAKFYQLLSQQLAKPE